MLHTLKRRLLHMLFPLLANLCIPTITVVSTALMSHVSIMNTLVLELVLATDMTTLEATVPMAGPVFIPTHNLVT